ncbi:MAG: YceI family protein [Gammaproteobacteria bacterium]|jgi:polyisoprenoid-binding protein YceI|nr:YceI family protein [Gammaproteobacteria bacterium]
MKTLFDMMIGAILAFLLGGIAVHGVAAEEICEPFDDDRVNPEILAGMLEAAQDGYLYRIQPATSKVGFCVTSMFAPVNGQFDEFRGGLAWQPVAEGHSQALVMVRTDSLHTENALVDKIIKGEGFFDAKRHPEILFVSRGIKWTTPKTAVMHGDLTLRGVTRPVDFAVELAEGESRPGKVQNVTVKATTSINRSDFGIGKMSRLVKDDVRLCLSIDAIRVSPESLKLDTRSATRTGQGAA